MTKRYRVTAAAAIFTHQNQKTVSGPARTHVYRGAPVPDGATPEEIRHHLDMRMIEEIEEGVPGIDADGALVLDPAPDRTGQQPAAADPGPAEDEPEPDGDAAAVRAAAAAKLPPDGRAPDGRAAKAVWVEYGVTRGHDRAELERTDKPDLVALLKD